MKLIHRLKSASCAGDSGVGRSLLARELTHGTFSVFSVLHDPIEGETPPICSPSSFPHPS